MSILLDTHVWLWFANGSDKLSTSHSLLLRGAMQKGLAVSAVSVWEIAMLVYYERLKLDRSPQVWVADSLQNTHIKMLPLTAEIALESYRLPGEIHRDPADRMIIATSRQTGYPLVTQDRAILEYAAKGHVAVL